MDDKIEILIAIAVVFAVGLIFLSIDIFKPQVSNFEECANAGYQVMESYPRRCKTPDGKVFTEEAEEEEEADEEDVDEEDTDEELSAEIVSGDPAPGATVTLEVSGSDGTVADAAVHVNGDDAGTTDADGQITVTLPEDDEVEIDVRDSDREGELEIEFEDGRHLLGPHYRGRAASHDARGRLRRPMGDDSFGHLLEVARNDPEVRPAHGFQPDCR